MTCSMHDRENKGTKTLVSVCQLFCWKSVSDTQRNRAGCSDSYHTDSPWNLICIKTISKLFVPILQHFTNFVGVGYTKYAQSCISLYSFLTFHSLLVTWCTNSLTFNNCTLCPHCIYVLCIYLRTDSDLCHLQHKLIGFYNLDENCLQRGTDWVFK